MSTNNATPANVAHLAKAVPIPGAVAQAWLNCEAQGTPNPTNPLNIRFYGRTGQRKGPGADGTAGVGFASYASAAAGLDDAAWVLHTLSYYAGVRAVLGQSPLIVAHAIEASPWAGGHYGAGKGRDGCISRAVRKATTPAPPPPVTRYIVQHGDTLQVIAGKLWHDTSLWPLIYAVNRAVIGPDPNVTKPGQVLVIPKRKG
jgi:nucleoid-associated protein YgaU